MRRRRLAVVLAVVLGLAALSVSVVAAVAFFGPRDYKLIRLLEKTKRVELSTRQSGWRVFEVPQEQVADLVAAATHGLERTQDLLAPPEAFNEQIRFCLDTGEEVILPVTPSPALDYPYRYFVRLPGDPVLRAFRGNFELVRALDMIGYAPKPTPRHHTPPTGE